MNNAILTMGQLLVELKAFKINRYNIDLTDARYAVVIKVHWWRHWTKRKKFLKHLEPYRPMGVVIKFRNCWRLR